MKLIPQIKQIIKTLLPYKFFNILKKIKFLFAKKTASCGYKIISSPNYKKLEKKYSNVWKNPNIPKKQLQLSKAQVPNYQQNPAMNGIVEQLKKFNITTGSVLEIGCSTGYYGEIFKKAGFDFLYSGCDYSETFIEQARAYYPEFNFFIADSTNLPINNNQYDIVISGSCILHIVDYRKAISETARIAKGFVIFHRTPVVIANKTLFTTKIGYGQKMVEIIFNEADLINIFKNNNLKLIDSIIISESTIGIINEKIYVKTYLCQKI